MFYIKENDKIVLYDENKERLENTLIFMPQYQELEILETEREIIQRDNEFVFKDTVLDQLAVEKQTYLIEQINYPKKAEIAYTGVRFDYNGEELVFETNRDSMSMINFTLAMIQSGSMTSVNGWKCRKTVAPYEPVSVNFTVQQFQALVTFAGQMVTAAFTVEEQINTQIKSLTQAQLMNDEYIAIIETQIANAYAEVPIKIQNLFGEE